MDIKSQISYSQYIIVEHHDEQNYQECLIINELSVELYFRYKYQPLILIISQNTVHEKNLFRKRRFNIIYSILQKKGNLDFILNIN